MVGIETFAVDRQALRNFYVHFRSHYQHFATGRACELEQAGR